MANQTMVTIDLKYLQEWTALLRSLNELLDIIDAQGFVYRDHPAVQALQATTLTLIGDDAKVENQKLNESSSTNRTRGAG